MLKKLLLCIIILAFLVLINGCVNKQYEKQENNNSNSLLSQKSIHELIESSTKSYR